MVSVETVHVAHQDCDCTPIGFIVGIPFGAFSLTIIILLMITACSVICCKCRQYEKEVKKGSPTIKNEMEERNVHMYESIPNKQQASTAQQVYIYVYVYVLYNYYNYIL